MKKLMTLMLGMAGISLVLLLALGRARRVTV